MSNKKPSWPQSGRDHGHRQLDPRITEALKKFQFLNNKYKVDADKSMLKAQQLDLSSVTKSKKLKLNTNMQLKYLQNAASLSKADIEAEKQSYNKSAGARSSQKWRKGHITINQPYLQIYKNFLEEQKPWGNFLGQSALMKSITSEIESEEERLTPEQLQSRKLVQFSKELKPYHNIIKFTVQRIKEQNDARAQTAGAKRRARSLPGYDRQAEASAGYRDLSSTLKVMAERENNGVQQRSRKEEVEMVIERELSRIYCRSRNAKRSQTQDGRGQQGRFEESNAQSPARRVVTAQMPRKTAKYDSLMESESVLFQ